MHVFARCRGVLMRAEVAVCLLAEVAYEHDEDFRGHLPLLFHSMLLLMDSSETLVFRHAQQVVIHLLHSLCARHLELHRAAGAPPTPPLVSLPAIAKRTDICRVQLLSCMDNWGACAQARCWRSTSR